MGQGFGDGVVEVVAGDIVVELPSPAAGKLIEKHASEDDVLEAGQLLARIE